MSASTIGGVAPSSVQRSRSGLSGGPVVAAGVTTLAATEDTGAALDALRETGLRGVVYREVFGPDPQQAFTPDEHTHLRFRFADAGPEGSVRRDLAWASPLQWMALVRPYADERWAVLLLLLFLLFLLLSALDEGIDDGRDPAQALHRRAVAVRQVFTADGTILPGRRHPLRARCTTCGEIADTHMQRRF